MTKELASPKRVLPELTQLQYDFVKNYITNGFNAEQAAISAGYSQTVVDTRAFCLPNSPSVKPLIDKALDKARDTILSRLGVGLTWRIKKLKKVVDQYIPDDAPIQSHEPCAVALKAIAELNKIAGDYAPDKRLALTVDLTKDKLKEARKIYDEY